MSCETLEAALVEVAAVVSESSRTVSRGSERALAREIAPSEQVAVRVEVGGPRVRAGVDVHGDGSTTAFTGRWIRKPVAAAGRETAVQSLRRVLDA